MAGMEDLVGTRRSTGMSGPIIDGMVARVGIGDSRGAALVRGGLMEWPEDGLLSWSIFAFGLRGPLSC